MDLTSAAWRKSRRSGPDGSNCVEVAAWSKSSLSGPNGGERVEVAARLGVVAVRDSKDPDGPALTFTPKAWRAFTRKIKHG